MISALILMSCPTLGTTRTVKIQFTEEAQAYYLFGINVNSRKLVYLAVKRKLR
jgi:hypothetical protein